MKSHYNDATDIKTNIYAFYHNEIQYEYYDECIHMLCSFIIEKTEKI